MKEIKSKKPRKPRIVGLNTIQIVNADFISNLRKELGLTQRDFAQILGTDVTTYARWETGKRPLGVANSRLLYLIAQEPEIVKYLYEIDTGIKD